MMNKAASTVAAVQSKVPALAAFFEGKLYPILIGILVFLGHTTKLEFWFNFPVMLSATLALVICDSIRGFLPGMLMMLYQITYEHGFSDYYFTPPVFVVLVIMVVLMGLCFVYFFIKHVAPMIKWHSPLLFPLAILSVFLLTNGLFSGEWRINNLYYSMLQVLAYPIMFYALLYGMKSKDREETMEYVTLIASVVALVVAGELAVLYISGAVIVDGNIVKENVHLGWGMWNPIGFTLTALIPLIMRGAIVGKHRTVYLVIAFIVWGGAILSMSRNAQLFSTLTVAACVVIGAFSGKRKLLFRILLATGVLGVLCVAVLFWDKLLPLAEKFLYDNGRFDLWKSAITNFTEAPIFGKGFYGFGQDNVFASFLPWLAHNTVLTMLSATGILGTLAYLFYRVCTARIFFKNMSLDKLMLLLPILVTLGMSLIDNYTFHVYTTFIYSLCLAVAFEIGEGKDAEEVKI